MSNATSYTNLAYIECLRDSKIKPKNQRSLACTLGATDDLRKTYTFPAIRIYSDTDMWKAHLPPQLRPSQAPTFALSHGCINPSAPPFPPSLPLSLPSFPF